MAVLSCNHTLSMGTDIGSGRKGHDVWYDGGNNSDAGGEVTATASVKMQSWTRASKQASFTTPRVLSASEIWSPHR